MTHRRTRELVKELLEVMKETTPQVLDEEKNIRSNFDVSLKTSEHEIAVRSDSLERDSEQLKLVLELIHEQRASLARQKSLLRNANQPVLRLPDEVLSSIFEIGRPVPEDNWSDSRIETHASSTFLNSYSRSYHAQLVAVGLVCHRFREVLVNTPRCWTDVVYRIGESRSSSDRTLNDLESVLYRSKGCSFSLLIRVSGGLRDRNSYLYEAVRNTLRPHLHRCRCLVMVCSNAELLSLLAEENLTFTPMHFDFRAFEDVAALNDEDYDPIIAMENMNQNITGFLSTLKSPLHSLGLDHDLGYDAFRFSQQPPSTLPQSLTRLHLCVDYDIERTYKFLDLCILLEHLNLSFMQSDITPDDVEEQPRTIVLQSLRSLHVMDYSFSSPSPGFILVAPSLEIVTMPERPFRIFHPQQPDLPSLVTLKTTLSKLDESNPPKFFYRHPRIKHLSITAPKNSDNASFKILSDAIEAFIRPTSTTLPQSKLSSLSIRLHHGKHPNRRSLFMSIRYLMVELPELSVTVEVYGISKKSDKPDISKEIISYFRGVHSRLIVTLEV